MGIGTIVAVRTDRRSGKRHLKYVSVESRDEGKRLAIAGGVY